MDTLRVWAVLLLGMFMVSMSGQAVAQGGHGGHGGYYRHGGHGTYLSGITTSDVFAPVFWYSAPACRHSPTATAGYHCALSLARCGAGAREPTAKVQLSRI